MADLQALFEVVNELTADELKQLYLYITETRVQFRGAESAAPIQSDEPRVLGLHSDLGKAWMSDDFDAELPDLLGR